MLQSISACNVRPLTFLRSSSLSSPFKLSRLIGTTTSQASCYLASSYDYCSLFTILEFKMFMRSLLFNELCLEVHCKGFSFAFLLRCLCRSLILIDSSYNPWPHPFIGKLHLMLFLKRKLVQLPPYLLPFNRCWSKKDTFSEKAPNISTLAIVIATSLLLHS